LAKFDDKISALESWFLNFKKFYKHQKANSRKPNRYTNDQIKEILNTYKASKRAYLLRNSEARNAKNRPDLSRS